MFRNKKAFIIAISITLFIACATGIYLVQNLVHTRTYLCECITRGIMQSTTCDFTTQVTSCHLIPLTITCAQAYARPCSTIITRDAQPAWSWHCKKLVFKFSWLGLIFLHKLVASVEIDGLEAHSDIVNNTLAIANHLQKIFLGKFLSMPVTIKTLKINHAQLHVCAPEYHTQALVYFSGLSKKNNREFKSIWHVNTGTIFYKDRAILEYCTGTFTSHFVNKKPKDVSLAINARAQLAPEQYTLVYANAHMCDGCWHIDAHVPDFLHDDAHVHAVIAPPAEIHGTAYLESVPLTCFWQYKNRTLELDLTNTHTITLLNTHYTLLPTHVHATLDQKNVEVHAHVGIENMNTHKRLEKVIRTKSSINTLTFPIHQTFTYEECAALLPPTWHTLFPGNGTITIDGTLGWPISRLNLSLNHGTITLGKSCNLCTGFSSNVTLNSAQKNVCIDNTHIKLYYGTISCPQAQCMFDNRWHLTHVHVPLTINHCLINWNKNIGIGSGTCVLNYAPHHAQITAHLALEKAYLASTIVAQLQQPNTLAHAWTDLPFDIDAHIETKKSVHIAVAGLQTHAHATLDIHGTPHHVHHTGTLTLVGGTISLPTCTLTITSGTIHLDPTQLDQSLIELSAKTHVRHHTIQVYVLGTIKNPLIKLSSFPARTEEQITALLIAGSADTSLNTLLPTLITQTITQLFAQQQLPQHTSTRITFVPRLTDVTGSGIAGGIAIDLNDRLHATVHKNLDLHENIALELEYALSDEVDLKAFKDPQGQIGGQARMTLKW